MKPLQEKDSKESKKQKKQITIQEAFMNEQEGAHRTGMSVKWFRNQRQLGKGPPFIKIGSRVLYHIEETDEWFISHTTQPLPANDNSHMPYQPKFGSSKGEQEHD